MNQTPRNLSKVEKALLARSDLAPARDCFEKVARVSREWNTLVAKSVKRYGDRPQGGFVSGIYSEHFPQRVQNALRSKAHYITFHSDEALRLRPRGVRSETMRALRLAVIARDGSGYYG